MSKPLERYEEIERSLIKKYRKELWAPFVTAIKKYDLIQAGDRVCVCISGGKDSMLMAKLFQMLHRVTEIPFDLEFLLMDPGYSMENRRKIEENAALLHIPLTVRESDIFRAVEHVEKNPCYLCARMRRGYLYRFARELGCNKIALGHHFNDVIETTVLALFYASMLQGMMPRVKSKNFEGMELIRPMYRVHEEDIQAWCRYHSLSFIQCACRFTEAAGEDEHLSKRKEIKTLLKTLRESNPDIEKSVFNAIHAVCVDTFPGWKEGNQEHSFLEKWDGGASEE